MERANYQKKESAQLIVIGVEMDTVKKKRGNCVLLIVIGVEMDTVKKKKLVHLAQMTAETAKQKLTAATAYVTQENV